MNAETLVDVELPHMPPAVDEPPVETVKRGRGRPRKTAPTPPAPKIQPVKDSAPKGPGRPSKADKLEEQLTAQLAMIGTAMMFAPWTGAPYDGACVMAGAPAIAGALAEVAKTNPAVRKTLEALTSASAWGGVAVAVLGVVAPIAANHQLVPVEAAQVIGGAIMADASAIAGATAPPPSS